MESDYQFISALGTASRLMGVIGLKIQFKNMKNENIFLLFHLDYEEYGFDRMEVCSDHSLHKEEMDLAGNLGEPYVELSLTEASSLIYEAIEVGDKYFYDVPVDFYDYEYLLDESCPAPDEYLLRKVSKKSISDIECIHYYVMRTVALDHGFRDLVLGERPFSYDLIEEPSELLKNEIVSTGGTYIVKSLINHLNSYKLIISELQVEMSRVKSAVVLEEMIISSKEALFLLNKKEYLLVFYVRSGKEFVQYALNSKPEVVHNTYESGVLFTEFHKNNNHVGESVYYLNGDMYASYYVTGNQVVVSCFDQDSYGEIKNRFLDNYATINLLSEMEADEPILYDFVLSGSTDIFEYLGE